MNRARKALADVTRMEFSKPLSPQEKLLLDLLNNSNELLVRLEKIEKKLDKALARRRTAPKRRR
jgi:hypothetical protein